MGRRIYFKILNKLNDKGLGLIGVMVAAALVLIAALTVSRFISDQYKLSTRLEISGNCQTIANSIVEYIKKDEASLFISSYGPTPGETTYPAGLDVTDDGVDRFRFGPSPINAFVSTSGTTMSIPSTSAPLPAGWRYYNHLNIRNSVNRLVALAASDNYCCDSLDMSNGTCGTLFYSDTKSVPGFTITDKNVEIRLATAFEGQSCVGRRLAMADVPDSRTETKANFKVRVTTRRGTPQEQSCEGSGSVQRSPDANGSLTVLQYDTNLCGASQTVPAICGGTPSIQIRVRSFKNAAASDCQANCLMQTTSDKTCAEITAGDLSLFNTLSDPACTNNCLASEPGTAFLCRIGEHNWMQANPNFWEPCETASIRDQDGSVIAPVQIQYVPVTAGNAISQRSGQAIITLTNLRNMRGYSADVRAVDTAGNIGPAFCGALGSPSCNATRPHFTVLDAVVTLGPITDTVNRVGPVSQNVVGRSTTLTGTARYQNALNVFQPNQYQCQDGAPALSAQISYNPALPGGFVPTHQCTASYQFNGGAAVNLPADQCVCTTTECTAQMPNLASRGNYALTISPTNDCGPIPTPPATPPVLNWCLDDNTAIGVNHPATINGGPTPNFGNIISNITTANKACGVATMCPRQLDGTAFTPVLGTSCSTVSTGWIDMARSGCLADPAGNYCAVVFDPCGRYEMTNDPPPAIQYSSTLRGVTHSASPATNQCFRFNGVQVGGNQCETGAFCSRTGKCFNTCAKQGDACSLAEECDDPSYGVTSEQAGGPQCVGGRCTCPTNRWTPSANNCSQRYCPELNSCPGAIGSTPPAVGACVACSNWNVGPWSLCVNGNKTRSVSCPTGCCIGPEPDSSSTCPDCVSPWGTEVLDGASITAYQTATVGCGETCASETRTCNNGTLSGSFTQQSCSVGACGFWCYVENLDAGCSDTAPPTQGSQCTSVGTMSSFRAQSASTACADVPPSFNMVQRWRCSPTPCASPPPPPGALCWGGPTASSGTLEEPYTCLKSGSCTTLNDRFPPTGYTKCKEVGGFLGAGYQLTCIEPVGAPGTPMGCVLPAGPPPSFCPCEYTQGGGYKPVKYVGTAAECAQFAALAPEPGYSCVAASFSSPPPANCTTAYVEVGSPWLTDRPMGCEPMPPPQYPPTYGLCSMADVCSGTPVGQVPNHKGCCFENACGSGSGFSGMIRCAQNPDGTWGFDEIDCGIHDTPGMLCQ